METKPQFKLPPGYCSWCHICGDPPFNKGTEVPVGPPTMGYVTMPGIGFKTWKESRKHAMTHRQYKG